MADTEEGWVRSKRILVVLAHPDDPEFFCGGTIARWVENGHEVHYCLLTRGDKGSKDPNMRPEALASLREKEQQAAASELGVQSVLFLDYPDGGLVADLAARAVVTGIIRKERPDIVVTCDPTNYFPEAGYINHPDHRAAGQLVVDSVMPAAYLPHYFPEQIQAGLTPHRIEELWLALTERPDVIIDSTAQNDRKMRALLRHQSQIGDVDAFVKEMTGGRTPESSAAAPRYVETFRRIILGG